MKNTLLQVFVLLAVILIATSSARQGQLLNYDDERYIAGNPWLVGDDFAKDESIWTAFFDGHYHPLTLLSLQVDSSFGGDSIQIHHQFNWLLHGANSLVLAWFLFLLTGDRKLAFVSALLWGLHPQAVESYAWITERKNVLYTLFFILSAIQYLKFIREGAKKRWIYTAIFFLLACLSKGQGILLIPVYFLLDYYEKGKIQLRFHWKEKLPLVVLAIGFALVGRLAQAEAWDLGDQAYGLGSRIFLGSYAFMAYIFHTIIPWDLSPYYPYPSDVGLDLGIVHYVSPLVVIAYLGAVYMAYKKERKLWFFGLSWFFVNVVLLLKILPVPYGAYLMADRYAYVPMIGLIVPLVDEISGFLRKNTTAKYLNVIVLIGVAVAFIALSQNQLAKWKTSVNLWTAVSEKHPNYSHALNMLGLGALAENDIDLALSSFRELSNLEPESAKGPLNIAMMYERMEQRDEAEEYLNVAIEREPESELTLEKGATLYLRWGRQEEAMEFTQKGIQKYPQNEALSILHSKVLVREGRIPEAMNLLASLKPSPEIRDLLTKLQQAQRSLQNTTTPTSMSEQEEEARKYMTQAIEQAKQGNNNIALELFDQAIETDPLLSAARANRGSFYAKTGELEKAEQDFLKALELKEDSPAIWMMLGMLYSEMGNLPAACTYYKLAASAGMQVNPQILSDCEQIN